MQRTHFQRIKVHLHTADLQYPNPHAQQRCVRHLLLVVHASPLILLSLNSGNLRWTHAHQVDFTPENSVQPAAEPAPFPPASFTPGSVGDEYYSPLVVVDNIGGSVWNAPIVASGVDTEFLNQFCDMDTIPENMAEEAYKYVLRGSPVYSDC